MVKKLLALSICVAQLTVGYAQIKIADDAYKQDMTATKYLTEPLAISNVLSEYDGTYLRDYFNKNIVGDTLYTNGHWAKCLVVNKKDKTIELKSGDVNEGVTIPKGYYRVTSLFFGKSGRNEIISEIASLVEQGYDKDPLKKKWACTLCERGQEDWNVHWKTDIEKQIYCGDKSIEELNVQLQRYNQQGKTCDISDLGGCGYCLESTDGSMVYYTYKIGEGTSIFFFPLRYYNFLNDELKGKDVLLTHGNPITSSGICSYSKSRETKDALTGKTIFLKDTLSRCVDVVLGEKLEPCCVLEGEKTGKFAVAVYRLIETEKKDECLHYYPTPSGGMTIWQSEYGQKFKGRLSSDRHFSVGSINYDDPFTGSWLIKVDDLNRIFEETKKYESNVAEREKQMAQRYKSWQEKRKKELCAKYGAEFGEYISNHKMALNMTPEMCKEAWGMPTRIYNMVDGTGTYTVWRYNFSTFIFFMDGKVAMIQN